MFLSPQILLLPNATDGFFELWQVPSTPDTAPTRPILALGLPPLKRGHFISMLSCRGEPNPAVGGLPYSTRPYNSSAMDAIIIFNLRIQGIGVIVPGNSFSIFAHRRALLQLCPDAPLFKPDDDVVPLIPWAQWGPSITRWLGAGVMPTRWITTTSGQRCVFRLARTGNEPSPIVVLDFHPTSVKRAAAAEGASRCISCFARPSEIDHRSFEVSVMSALPYACYASPDVFDYDGLLMDEDRLIGLQVHIFSCVSIPSILTYHPIRLMSWTR